MKARNKFERKIEALSAKVKPLTEAQRKWMDKAGCVAVTSKHKAWCTVCGEEISKPDDELKTVVCPHCGSRLEIRKHSVLKRRFEDSQILFIIQVVGGMQLIRSFEVNRYSVKGCESSIFMNEVVRHWLAPDGKRTAVESVGYMGLNYNVKFNKNQNMTLKSFDRYRYVCYDGDLYPRYKVLPVILRNGFKGKFYAHSPIRFFERLMTDSQFETVIKSHIAPVLATDENGLLGIYFGSFRIAIRKKYHVIDYRMWMDYLSMMRSEKMDLLNPKLVCPENLREAHDLLNKKIMRRQEREERERRRLAEEARKKAEAEALIKSRKYDRLLGKLGGIVFSENGIDFMPLLSVRDFYDEGKAMHHCVFSGEYYKKRNTVVFSARKDGERVETVEYNTRQKEVVQCYGKFNHETEYHDMIVNIVNSRAEWITKEYNMIK